MMFGSNEYKKIKVLLPKYTDIYASQEGEDILLRRLFKSDYLKKGFYVDVGAHDPVRFSTTLHFYLNGWNGINIDPAPGFKCKFDKLRERDINIEIGISSKEEELSYYSFSESAFNTFNKRNAQTIIN